MTIVNQEANAEFEKWLEEYVFVDQLTNEEYELFKNCFYKGIEFGMIITLKT